MLRRLLPLVLALAMGGAWAQSYPAKPVRIIVPFGPGGPDALARLLGAQLTQQTGQPFVVENKPGANGVIGAEFVAKSAPDGYTLMVTSSGLVTAPSMYKKLPYDTERDFAPVTNLVENAGIFVAVNPDVPARTLQELIELARKPDSKLSYGSPGIGTTPHLAGELFNHRRVTPAHAEGAHRARAQARQQAFLRLARDRQHAAPRRRAVQPPRRDSPAAHPLQGGRP